MFPSTKSFSQSFETSFVHAADKSVSMHKYYDNLGALYEPFKRLMTAHQNEIARLVDQVGCINCSMRVLASMIGRYEEEDHILADRTAALEAEKAKAVTR